MSSSVHLSGEKKIQNEIFNRLSYKGYKYDILDEEYKDLKLNENHKYLLLDSYVKNDGNEVFKGLRKHIERHNSNLIEEFKDNYTKDDLIKILLDDFIARWDSAKSNTEYYNLVFKAGHCTVSLKNHRNTKVLKSYNVISFNYSSDNDYTIIKEKRMEGRKGLEQPDFAMYINGIPLIVWEVKTKQSTLNKAFKEYGLKETYSKFILCLGTDGSPFDKESEVFLTGSKKIFFKWKKYGRNISSNYIFKIEDYLIQDKHTLEDERKIQALIKNNVDESNREALLEILDRYMVNNKTNNLEFEEISSYLSRISLDTPEKKSSLIDEIKSLLIEPTSGLEDIIEELFDHPSNLLFYFKYCVMLDKAGKDEDENYFLINHRVQQYYTIKALDRKLNILKNKNDHKNELMSELVKHVQRSGKSITIRSAVNLIADKYSHLFRKLYICVPDLTILNVMLNTFQNNDIKVKRVQSRGKFIESINESNASFIVYLYNIQKTKDPEADYSGVSGDDFVDVGKYLGNDALFIIDEVHFAQSRTQADIRANCFPKASFLTFTATPKIKEKGGEIINQTAVRYSESTDNGKIYYLDELNATEAVEMGIILPVVYEKVVFEQQASLENAVEFDSRTKELVEEFISKGEYDIKISAEQDDAERLLRGELEPKLNKGISESELIQEVENVRKSVKQKYLEKALKEVEKIEKTEALNQLRSHKIEYIINDMNKKRESCFSDNEKPLFRTKAFFVVESQKEAQRYIEVIRALSENNTNTYQNYRFGVDFSEGQQSTNEMSLLSELNLLSPDIKVINKFEEQNQKNDPIDVLIIVNKYLMGYDNKELVAVYCDKTINEPAKLYQLITRSATTRVGKEQGFFVDMTFGDDNYRTYTEKCLPYYNNNSGTSISTLKKEEVLIQKNLLNSKILEIKELLEYEPDDLLLDEVDIYNRLLSRGSRIVDGTEAIKKKKQYFDFFKEINVIMGILIKPRYYMNNFDEILVLSKVNARYLKEDCPKPEEAVVFDRNAIKKIIIESLKFFGLTDLEEINNFKINGANIKDEKLLGRVNFNNVVTEFKQRLVLTKTNKPKGLTELINKWSEQILTESDAKLAINQLNDKFVKPFEDNQLKKEETIKNDFNGSIAWFMANESINDGYTLIEEYLSGQSFKDKKLNEGKSFSDQQFDDYFDVFTKEYSKLISDELSQIISETNVVYEKQEKYVEKIVNNISIDLKSISALPSIVSLDKSTAKEIKKAFWNDSKRLREILQEGRDVSEIIEVASLRKDVGVGTFWILFMFERYYNELRNRTL